MQWLVVLAVSVALGCGSSRQPTLPDTFNVNETTDAGIVHPQTNGQSCGQCHDGARAQNGS